MNQSQSDITGRFFKASNEFERVRNYKPKRIYLGHEEYMELQKLPRELCVFNVPASFKERITAFGLPVYRVDSDNHMELG